MKSEDKRISQLNQPKGKLLFFGGVYSNLQALEALKEYTRKNEIPPGNIFCTGDILGYCAQPNECIELLKDWGIHSIAGNVELQIRNNADECGCDFNSGGRCDLFSKNWYSYIRSNIKPQSKEWLHTLPHHIQFAYGNNNITILHGSWKHTSEFIFASTDWTKKQRNFEASSSNIIVAGHCGLPFLNNEENCYWVNAGVIGMPANDGNTKVWFLTLELKDDKPHFQFHQLAYDYTTASTLMKQNGLPTSYANTLVTGIWDNCEILPPEETAMQGKEILLKE